jgi:hypothetical protein
MLMCNVLALVRFYIRLLAVALCGDQRPGIVAVGRAGHVISAIVT